MTMCMNGHESKLEVCLLSLQVQGPELAACNVCSKVWFSDSYTKHLLFHIKWSNQVGIVKRWVTIDPKFLKGWRYQDDVTLPKTWFREHLILVMNFIFWVIIHSITDCAFKGISSVEEFTGPKTSRGQRIMDSARAPLFPNGHSKQTKSGQRSDILLVKTQFHESSAKRWIRGPTTRPRNQSGARKQDVCPVLINYIAKASEATRSQALNHQDHNTFLKYQAQLKALDMQALMYGMEPDYEC
ncbi:hypothetical protein GB937_007464 [Aspergillus fischeri]|nr:hypothetical protein GB937_007464 [Aspergillus fischeri]